MKKTLFLVQKKSIPSYKNMFLSSIDMQWVDHVFQDDITVFNIFRFHIFLFICKYFFYTFKVMNQKRA